MTSTKTSRRYRCGVTHDCPFAVLYLAGLDFPKMTEKVTGNGPETKRTEIRGVVRSLEDDQVAAIKKAAAKKFVRTSNGKFARSRLFSTASKGFTRQEGDVCVLSYLYLEPTEASEFEEVRPKTLAEELAEAKAPKAADEVSAPKPTSTKPKSATKRTK